MIIKEKQHIFTCFLLAKYKNYVYDVDLGSYK